ncbi:yeats family-domain-containing protein [Gaertneriomyces semiglobifer]|nr:yeats family-domain-containing protein [Gaertneriomyces semiglobifer]
MSRKQPRKETLDYNDIAGAKNRVSGVILSRPIIYGSTATLLKSSEKSADETHTHKWSVYVRGIHNEDLSIWIKKVTFKLHESFENPKRDVEEAPFEINETGWGEFDIQIKIHIQDYLEAKATIQLQHTLRLHHTDVSTAASKPVISEHYEEIIFKDPTEEAYAKLTANPVPVITKREKVGHKFTPLFEQDEVTMLEEANQKVLAQLKKIRAQIETEEDSRGE